jgi:hypothetical protein
MFVLMLIIQEKMQSAKELKKGWLYSPRPCGSSYQSRRLK